MKVNKRNATKARRIMAALDFDEMKIDDSVDLDELERDFLFVKRFLAATEIVLDEWMVPAGFNIPRCAFKKCKHEHTTRDTPRAPLAYGTAPTENCLDCGGYRTLDRWLSDWRPGPVPSGDGLA